MISIIIPLYNKESTVAQTLACIFQQTYKDFEIVVVDDGSTDQSAAVVERINDSRIRLIKQKNGGVSAARNRGIAEAKYELLALMDADDEWKPDYLQTQMDLVSKYPQCDVFCCNYEFKSAEGNVSPTIIRKLPFTGTDGILSNYFEVASCSHPPICSISIMVRKAAIQSVGGFPVGIKSGEDLLTWARLAVKYQIAYSTKVLSTFVNSCINDNSKPKERFSEEDAVLKGLQQLYLSEGNSEVKRHLKSYILRWYKIQCVIMLEIGMGWKCCIKAQEALKNGGAAKHFLPLIILGLLPNCCFYYIKKIRKQ